MPNCLARSGVTRAIARVGVLLALIGAFVSVTTPAHAQFTRFETYGDERGLGDLAVNSIAQDASGYMLLGTEGGLYRFNGQSFAREDAQSGLPGAFRVFKVLRDHEDRVWVVMAKAIYLRGRSRYRQVDLGANRFNASGPHFIGVLAHDVVILNAAGQLQRASVTGDAVGPFAPMLPASSAASPPPMARFVVADGDGVLFGCGTALCRAGLDGRMSVLGADLGLPAKIWQDALRTRDGTLWVRSIDRLSWKGPNDAVFRTVIIPGRHETYMAEHPEKLELVDDGHGGILTQGDDGFLRFVDGAWQVSLHHSQGVSEAAILTFFRDRDGSLWLGSAGYGAARSLGMDRWEHWTRDDGLPSDNIWAATRLPSGQIWVATDARSLPLDHSSSGIAGTTFTFSITRRGLLWLAPFGSPLTRVDPVRNITQRGPSIGRVDASVIDSQNRLWLSTREGVYMIADADADIDKIRLQRVATTTGTTTFAIDAAGAVWFATPDGVFRWRDGHGPLLMAGPDVLRASPSGLSFADNGDLWVATEESGVVRLRPEHGALTLLPPIVEPQIASNTIMFVHRDRRGQMWVGTSGGIDMWDHGTWHRFDESDGPISNDLNQGAVFDSPDGSMWFGTSHGLSHLLDAGHAPALPPPPHPPIITHVSLGDTALSPGGTVCVAWTKGSLRISFDDLNYVNGPAMRFRYRLGGVDTGWNETTDRVIQYAAPPAGHLQFALMAVDPSTGRVSSQVGFEIVVRAPWWRRPIFVALIAIVLVAILSVAWRLRVRFLLIRQVRLEYLIGARTRDIERAREELARRATQEQQRLEEMVEIRTAEIEEARAELQRLAMSDALTGLPNRRALILALESAAQDATHHGRSLAVLLCDIDHFKSVNDRYGHLVGDRALVQFGQNLAACLGEGETAGRYGGEEFLVILQGDAMTTASRVAEIHAALAVHVYAMGDIDKAITFSGGLAFLRPSDNVVTLVARADATLYRAKRNGRARIEIERDDLLSPHHEIVDARQAAEAMAFENDLRHAIGGGELRLQFQPIIDVVRGVVVSCEALLWWSSPTRGDVAPGIFIPFAEQRGLMADIDAWVLREACMQAVAWPEALGVCVNISASHFYRAGLVEDIGAVLAQTGLPARRLEIELTETTMISNLDFAADTLAQLRSLGISIALDDFGTGYSSLSFLHRLPFDRIKIDRSFVNDLGVRSQSQAIVRGMVHLCAGLGAGLTAEGVETPRQMALLRDAGCRDVQGYGIARPMPSAQLKTWLAEFSERWRTQSLDVFPAAGRRPPDDTAGLTAADMVITGA